MFSKTEADHGKQASKTYFANERLNGIIARYALASYLRELLRSLKETQSIPRFGKLI